MISVKCGYSADTIYIIQEAPFLIYQHCIKGTFHFTFKKRAEVLQI